MAELFDQPAQPETAEGAVKAASPASSSLSSPREVVDDCPEPGSGAAPVEMAADLPVVSPPKEDEDESDLSSSASDVSGSGSELDGVLPPSDATSTMRWFQQGRKIHITQGEESEGRVVPWCRDVPFTQEPSRVGEGLAPVGQQTLCQRCLSRMPRALYAAISEHMNWLHWPVSWMEKS